jgi:hypothetical protein
VHQYRPQGLKPGFLRVVNVRAEARTLQSNSKGNILDAKVAKGKREGREVKQRQQQKQIPAG